MTSQIIFDPTSSLENFRTHLQALSAEEGTVMILSCDENGFEKPSMDPILQKSPYPLFGLIVPSIIYNDKKYDKGTLFIKFKDLMTINTIYDISTKDYEMIDSDVESQINGFSEEVKTMFVYVDGLTKNIGDCVNVLFDYYGLDINYIGGGSGSLSFEQKPSLFTNDGLVMDAFIYAYSKCKSAVGVSHGWQSIKGPYQVTKAEGTTIYEIDYKPAFEVYKEVVDAYSAVPIDEKNFFEVAKSFPFGLNTLSEEKIVRDPIVLDDNALVCVGNVPEGSYIDILYGEKIALIEAVKHAADISDKNLKFKPDFTLFIDCISRVLFLESDFKYEIDVVNEQKDIPLVGALTFGEIANNGRDYLAFYNKTSVVGYIGNG